MSWSREQVEVLIDENQKNPCLYAVKSANYKNKIARVAALERIERVVKTLKPSITISDIKIKWNGIRNNFLTEYKKVKMSSGSGANDVYKPTLWYFDRLFFLVEHSEVRDAMDSLSQQNDQLVDEELDTQDSIETEEPEMIEVSQDVIGEFEVTDEGILSPASSPSTAPSAFHYHIKAPKKRKREDDFILHEATNVLGTIATNMQNSRRNVAPPPNNADEILAKYIVSKLNQIKDINVRLDTEMEISNVLFKAIAKDREINKDL